MRSRLSAMAIAVALFGATAGHAQTVDTTWTAAATGTWSDLANWDANGIPLSSDGTVIQFDGSGATAVVATNDLPDSPFLVNGFVFNSSNTGGFTVAGANPFQFTTDLGGPFAPFINQNNTGLAVISAPVTFANAANFGGPGTGEVRLTSPTIGGTGAFTVNRSTQADLIRVTNAFPGGASANNVVNTNTAGWTVTTGTLRFEVNKSLANAATGLNAIATGTYQMNNTVTNRFNPIGHDGTTAAPITLGDGATVQVAAINDGSGNNNTSTFVFGNPVTIPAGTGNFTVQRLGGNATNKVLQFGALTLGDGATVNITQTNIRSNYQRLDLAAAGSGNVTINGSFVQILDAPTGAGATLNKNGSDLTLLGQTGVSDIAVTNIQTGRLFFNNQNAIGTGPINVSGGASQPALAYQGNVGLTISNVVTIADGGGIATRSNTLTLTNPVLPSSGLLQLNNDSNATNTVTLTGNYPALTGDMTFQLSGSRLNNTTNSIGTTVITGDIDLNGADRVITFDYAPIATSTPATANLFTVQGTVQTGANNLTVNGDGSATFATLAGSGNLTKGSGAGDTGILIVTTPSYTGTTAINFGTLRFNNLPATPTITQAAGSTQVAANFPVDQAYLNRFTAGSTGNLQVTQTSGNLDFSAIGAYRVGAPVFGYGVVNGVITPLAGGPYQFGTGGGALEINSALALPTAVDLNNDGGGNATAIVLTGTNTFTGGLTVGSNIHLTAFADANLGTAGGAITFDGGRLRFGNAFNLDAARPITVNATTFFDTNGHATTLSNALAGTGTFTKYNAGTMTFAATQTVPVAVAGGTALATAASGDAVTTGNLSMTGGTLQITPANTGNPVAVTSANAADTTTFGITSGTVELNRNGNPSLVYTVGNATGTANTVLNRAARGSLVIAPSDGLAGLGTTEQFVVNRGVTLVNGGTMAPAYIIGRDLDGTGNFLTHGVNGFVVAAPTTTDLTAAVAGSIVDTTGAALAGPVSAFAVRATGTIDLGAQTLTVNQTDGGLILNSATVQNGTVAFGGNGGNIFASGNSVVSAVVTGTNAVTVSGPGEVLLSGVNTFTGTIFVNGGTLRINGPGGTTDPTSLGATGGRQINLRGGTFRLTTAQFNPNGNTKSFILSEGGGTFDVATGGIALILDDGGQLSGSGPLVKTGPGVMTLGNNYTSFTGPSSVNQGTLRVINNVNSLGTGTGPDTAVSVNPTGTFDVQTTSNKYVFLNGGRLFSDNVGNANGQVLLTADSTVGANTNDTLNVNGTVSGAFRVTKTDPGLVTLNGTNTYSGGTTVAAGTLQSTTDANLGQALTELLFTGGTLRYGGVNAFSPDRPFIVNTTGGLDTNGFNPTFTSTVTLPTGAGTLTKTGVGVMTIGTTLPTGLTLNVTGGTNLATSEVDFNGQNPTLTGLLIGAPAVNTNPNPNLPARVFNVGNLTVEGTGAAFVVGNNAGGRLELNAGANLVVNIPGGSAFVGQRTTNNAGGFTGTLDATLANSVTFDVANLTIGAGLTTATAPGGRNSGILLLPTGAATATTITATTAVNVGTFTNQGNTGNPNQLVLGGGLTTITTPAFNAGGGKVSSDVTIVPGGRLAIGGPAGGNTNMAIGDHNSGGTGINAVCSFDMTGGTIGDFAGTAPARLGTVTIGLGATSGSGTAFGTSTGTVVIDGANSFVTAQSMSLASVRNANAGQTSHATGTFTLNNGVVRLDGPINAGFGAGIGGERTVNLNVNGGTLDMQNNNVVVTDVVNAPATIYNLTFNGGTWRDLGTHNRPVTQTGGLMLRSGAGTTSITGAYDLTPPAGQTATVQVNGAGVTTATLGITANARATVTGDGTIDGALTVAAGATIAPGNGIGTMTLSNGPAVIDGAFAWQIGVPGTPDPLFNGGSTNAGHDALSVTGLGSLSLTDPTVRIEEVGGFAGFDQNSAYSWTIATVAGSPPALTGAAIFDLTAAPQLDAALLAGGALSLAVTGNGLNVNYAPVPEPATVLMICGAAAGLARVVRRRK